jgi:glycosylphosphatidylinositol transamidase (GPIT) subunit GPI8
MIALNAHCLLLIALKTCLCRAVLCLDFYTVLTRLCRERAQCYNYMRPREQEPTAKQSLVNLINELARDTYGDQLDRVRHFAMNVIHVHQLARIHIQMHYRQDICILISSCVQILYTARHCRLCAAA